MHGHMNVKEDISLRIYIHILLREHIFFVLRGVVEN